MTSSELLGMNRGHGPGSAFRLVSQCCVASSDRAYRRTRFWRSIDSMNEPLARSWLSGVSMLSDTEHIHIFGGASVFGLER